MEFGKNRGESLVTVVFVEGGGATRPLQRRCREAFSRFFHKAGLAGSMPKVQACGGRGHAYDEFRAELSRTDDPETVLLLVDSERPVQGDGGWVHLGGEPDRWQRPDRAKDANVYLMVEVMESWFLADRQALIRFFGQMFREAALPQGSSIERIRKADVLSGLDAATKACKRRYHKGDTSFDVLENIAPAKVTDASPHAARLIETLERLART